MERKLIFGPNIEENIRTCLEYYKQVRKEPSICPVSNEYYKENWVERRKEFLAELGEWLNDFSKVYLKNPVVFWIYTKKDWIPVHRLDRVDEGTIIFSWSVGKDYYDGYLEVLTNNGEVKIYLYELEGWVIYSLESSLLASPRLPGSDDYTDRSYDRAFRSLVDQVSAVDPDLGRLLIAPGTMDYLITDMMAYLYDRLQTYIDLYASGTMSTEGRGEFLEKIAKYLGYSPIPPIPAFFPVVFKLSEDFLAIFNKKISKETIPVIVGKGISKLRMSLDNFDLNYFPKKIDLKGKSFWFVENDLVFPLSSSREFRIYGEDGISLYTEGTLVDETFVIDFGKYNEINLTKYPVDLGSITISGFYLFGAIYYPKIIKVPKDLFDLYAKLGVRPISFGDFIPILLFYDRDGKVKLVPIPTIRTQNLVAELKITYRTHLGSEGNGLRVKEMVKFPIMAKENTLDLFIESGERSFNILLSWDRNLPVCWAILDPKDYSSGGYDGDTDDDIRKVVSGYLSGELIRSSALFQYSRRAVIEEDYDLILKSFPETKIFKTKIFIYSKPLKIEETMAEVQEKRVVKK